MNRCETQRTSSRGRAERGADLGPKRASKGSLKRGKLPVALAVAMAGVLAVGGTVAWLTSSPAAVENSFSSSAVTCAVDESFDGTAKSDVHVHNTGDVDAYIRAVAVANWVKVENGTVVSVLGEAPIEGQGYELDLVEGSGWVEASDGYYYYANPVAPESPLGAALGIGGCSDAEHGSTAVMFEPIEVLSEAPEEGYVLAVDIVASAIQAKGVDASGKPAVAVAWESGVSGVNADGTLDVIEAE